MRTRGGGLFMVVIAALLGAALMPAGAGAATVVNGNFETGTLEGWNTRHETEAGAWYAYRGSEPPKGPGRGVQSIEAPPQGRYAAITDQIDPDSLLLWQDVALEPGASHVLSFVAYYQSQQPLVTPTPNTLATAFGGLVGQANEQFRIDVMKPTAALDSVAPEDILATPFSTRTGSPLKMAPTRFSVDLSPFAGQTVRIRVAVVNEFNPSLPGEKEGSHENLQGALNGGVDAFTIASAGPGLPGSGGKGGRGGAGQGSDRISILRPRPNRKNGTAILPVKVPAAGLITATGTKAKEPKLIVSARKRVAGATTAKLLIKPTKAARKLLLEKHKLRLSVTVRFDPGAGPIESRAVPVVLKLAPPAKHRR